MKSYSNASDIPPAVRSVFSAPPQTKEKARSYERAFSFMLIHRDLFDRRFYANFKIGLMF